MTLTFSISHGYILEGKIISPRPEHEEGEKSIKEKSSHGRKTEEVI